MQHKQQKNNLTTSCMFDLENLSHKEFKVHSQHGEDGIIETIFSAINTTNKFFVEIGSGDATECNCAYLLEKEWRGLFIDAVYSSNNPLAVVHNEFITAENVNDILKKYNVSEIIDLLSIDIDGNDYWIWKAINLKPRVIVIEYNAQILPQESKVIKYDPTFKWSGSSYFGASLLALKELGEQKGYTLVYCENKGVNAFFVVNNILPPNFKPQEIANLYKLPNYSNYPDDDRIMINPATTN